MTRTKALLAAVLAIVAFSPLATTGVRAQGATTVQVRAAGSFAAVLASPDGKTLYMFDRDTAGTSNCDDACTNTWPPLVLASGDPTGPASLSGKLATISRPDGKRQVTYNDKPIYNFSGDAQPGDTKGDGVGGIWHAVVPTAATTAAAPAQASPTAAPTPAAAAAPAQTAAPASATARPATPGATAAAASATARPPTPSAAAAAPTSGLPRAGTGGSLGRSDDHGVLAATLALLAIVLSSGGFVAIRRLRKPAARS